MEQLIHPVKTPPNALMLQQQAQAANFPVSPTAEGYSLSEVMRNPLANDVSASKISQSILTVLYEQEVESAHDEMTSEEISCNYQEELRQLSAQLLTIQESERQRIAADLHDGIGQSLSLIKLSLESVMQQLIAGESTEAAKTLKKLNHKVKETITELHRTTMDMRPSMLDDLGIIPTLSWFFREFESAWRGREVVKDVSIDECDVPVPLKTTIFRILQEAVNNIIKHANADKIKVSLKKTGNKLQLSIEDNGCGFDFADESARRCSGHGFGLLTMKERARSSGGTFEMKSTLEQGTRVLISWQLTNTTADQVTAQLPCARKLTQNACR